MTQLRRVDDHIAQGADPGVHAIGTDTPAHDGFDQLPRVADARDRMRRQHQRCPFGNGGHLPPGQRTFEQDDD